MLHFGNVMIPWDWSFGWVINLLVGVIIIVIMIRIVFRIVHGSRYRRRECCRAPWEPSGNNAFRILDERYAKGEIDDEEYRRKKENLK